VEGFSNQWPEKFSPARSVAEIRANFAQGKISIPMAIENGGVIQINFGSSFVSNDYLRNKLERDRHIYQYLDSHDLQEADEAAQQHYEEYSREHPIPYADVSDVVDHIDHVVKLIGVDHVGLGSDFDGVGDSLPYGLKDVSGYPNLIYQLLKRGYSETDIEKICSGNLLRVWSEVERIAQQLQTKG